MQIRKYHDFGNQKILCNLVDIFYQIHLKIIKTATNKKLRTIYTELYVCGLSYAGKVPEECEGLLRKAV